jgi:hypothetical protein
VASRSWQQPVDRADVPQTASGSSSAGSSPHCEAYAASTPPRAKTEPTERSMPSLMITKVMPSATIAKNDDWIVMLWALSSVPKVGNVPVAMRIIRMRTARAPCRWKSAATRSPRLAAAVPAAVPAAAAPVDAGPSGAGSARVWTVTGSVVDGVIATSAPWRRRRPRG